MKRYSAITLLASLFAFSVSGCSGIQVKESKEAQEPPVKVEKAAVKIRDGEKLKFSIRWLGMEVGTAEAVLKGIEEMRGRKAYHIAVLVRSNSVIDLVYPVRDEHHSYIDVEHFHSLRYEKTLREGRYRADEVMEFDQEAHQAVYLSKRSGEKKQMLIPKNTQDLVSATYWFRVQPMETGGTVTIPINTDERNWKFAVKILERERVHIDGLGIFEAVKLEPQVKFQGIFVQRGKMTGWMSTDDKRLPLLMKTKIPVLGSVNVVLVAYEGR